MSFWGYFFNLKQGIYYLQSVSIKFLFLLLTLTVTTLLDESRWPHTCLYNSEMAFDYLPTSPSIKGVIIYCFWIYDMKSLVILNFPLLTKFGRPKNSAMFENFWNSNNVGEDMNTSRVTIERVLRDVGFIQWSKKFPNILVQN